MKSGSCSGNIQANNWFDQSRLLKFVVSDRLLVSFIFTPVIAPLMPSAFCYLCGIPAVVAIFSSI